jgi:hypothetical protein
MGYLSASFVRSAKKPARHADGDELYLLVGPTGFRSWVCRVQKRGKRRDIVWCVCDSIISRHRVDHLVCNWGCCSGLRHTIVERQFFRSLMAILLFSENRFERCMVMLNPVRSYSVPLKTGPMGDVADTSLEQTEPHATVTSFEVDDGIQSSTKSEHSFERHWMSEIEIYSFAFHLDGLATIGKSHES